ncbi:MAG TPA: M23 family metallopeptidase [Nocardioides sp.]|nr:M23 family metallopeptidase [Nocardioides sp.]
MGNHRADHRGPIRRPSKTQKDTKYAGRRVAGRASAPADIETSLRAAEPVVAVEPVVETAASIPAVVPAVGPGTGKRKAVKHAGSRGALFKGLPSPPVLLGVASLAVAVGGVMTSTAPDLAGHEPRFNAASAMSGEAGVGSVNLMERSPQMSRDSRRDALEDASDAELVQQAEQVAEQRDAALGQLAQLAEQQADKIAENRWVLPIEPSIITARFGEYGLWSSYHTGLDFNGNEGDPIKAIANGVVTFVGSDGSYGNKTVVTLEDGTEIWYCHQSSYNVSEGDTVRGGEIIGAVGSTGHVTGSHLHIEVRPGGGDPVDPYAAFVVHGVTP